MLLELEFNVIKLEKYIFIIYACKPTLLDYSIKQNSFFDLRSFNIKILMWTVPMKV